MPVVFMEGFEGLSDDHGLITAVPNFSSDPLKPNLYYSGLGALGDRMAVDNSGGSSSEPEGKGSLGMFGIAGDNSNTALCMGLSSTNQVVAILEDPVGIEDGSLTIGAYVKIPLVVDSYDLISFHYQTEHTGFHLAVESGDNLVLKWDNATLAVVEDAFVAGAWNYIELGIFPSLTTGPSGTTELDVDAVEASNSITVTGTQMHLEKWASNVSYLAGKEIDYLGQAYSAVLGGPSVREVVPGTDETQWLHLGNTVDNQPATPLVGNKFAFDLTPDKVYTFQSKVADVWTISPPILADDHGGSLPVAGGAISIGPRGKVKVTVNESVKIDLEEFQMIRTTQKFSFFQVAFNNNNLGLVAEGRVQYDNLYIDHSPEINLLGPVQILILNPTFQVSSDWDTETPGESQFSQVTPPVNNSRFISADDSTKEAEFAMSSVSTGAEILALKATVRANTERAGSPEVVLSMKSGASNVLETKSTELQTLTTDSDGQTLNGVGVEAQVIASVDPNTGLAWTEAGANAVTISVKASNFPGE